MNTVEEGKRYTVTLEWDEETKEHILPLPEELTKELGWDVGDTVRWIDNKDGSFSLKKKEKK